MASKIYRPDSFSFPAPAVSEIEVDHEEQLRKERCILCLEALLQDAKEGKGFQSVFVVAVYNEDESIRHAWTSNMTTPDGVGRLEYLKFQLLKEMDDVTEEEDAEA